MCALDTAVSCSGVWKYWRDSRGPCSQEARADTAQAALLRDSSPPHLLLPSSRAAASPRHPLPHPHPAAGAARGWPPGPGEGSGWRPPHRTAGWPGWPAACAGRLTKTPAAGRTKDGVELLVGHALLGRVHGYAAHTLSRPVAVRRGPSAAASHAGCLGARQLWQGVVGLPAHQRCQGQRHAHQVSTQVPQGQPAGPPLRMGAGSRSRYACAEAYAGRLARPALHWRLQGAGRSVSMHMTRAWSESLSLPAARLPPP